MRYTTYDLRDEARDAYEYWISKDHTQGELAEAVGVDRSAVSRAVRNVGLKHAAVQARIISHVKRLPVQRRSTYEGSDVEHHWVIDP